MRTAIRLSSHCELMQHTTRGAYNPSTFAPFHCCFILFFIICFPLSCAGRVTLASTHANTIFHTFRRHLTCVAIVQLPLRRYVVDERSARAHCIQCCTYERTVRGTAVGMNDNGSQHCQSVDVHQRYKAHTDTPNYWNSEQSYCLVLYFDPFSVFSTISILRQ